MDQRKEFVDFILNEDGRWDKEDFEIVSGKFINIDAESAFYWWNVSADYTLEKAELNVLKAALRVTGDQISASDISLSVKA